MCVIRRHFRWVRADSRGNVFFAKYGDPSGGCQQSGANIFFAKYWWPVQWVPAVRWRNNYFAHNKEPFPCVRPWTQLSASARTVHFRCMSVVDHVDHATLRALGRWTTARPRKGTTQSRGRRGSGCPHEEEYEGSLVRLRYRRRRITGGVGEWSGGMAWPAVGVVWGR